jgi:metal-sulfur cluster biosynthetic enzyme
MVTEEIVLDALNLVEDPELMMGIVDLGLVYDVAIDGPKVKVTFTLTSMGCPVGPWIAEQVDLTVRGIDGVEEVESELVFTPPWTPDKMSDDAKFALGF